MALFTDGPISTLEELAAQDTQVLDIANTEGINATAKLSLAQDEVGIELTAAFSRSGAAANSASVWWPGSVSTLSCLQLQNIVVTSPLRLWHMYRSLELIYRDAYNSQLNDRYLGKWNVYKELAKRAADMMFQIGAGVVSDPIPIAQAPGLTTLGGALQAATYFMQAAWLNSRGEEGLVSRVASISTPDQSAVQVTPLARPPNATAWNVYAGSSIDSITLQNSVPLDPSGVWITPDSGLLMGMSPGAGQNANFLQQIPRYLQRG